MERWEVVAAIQAAHLAGAPSVFLTTAHQSVVEQTAVVRTANPTANPTASLEAMPATATV